MRGVDLVLILVQRSVASGGHVSMNDKIIVDIKINAKLVICNFHEESII